MRTAVKEDSTVSPELDKAQKALLKHGTFYGNEIVANTRRLCLMNMFLHNIGEIDGDVMISPNDALVAANGQSLTQNSGLAIRPWRCGGRAA